MTALDDALRSAARTPCLLVASDYDGVVAPIVADPDAAMPDTAAIEALAQLAATPDTHVAMISGRTLRDLRRVTGEPGEVMLLGSHGAETASGDLLSPSQLSIRDAIISEMAAGWRPSRAAWRFTTAAWPSPCRGMLPAGSWPVRPPVPI